jgi:hypothetical protein
MDIPGLHKSCTVLNYKCPQAVQFMGPKTMGLGEYDWVQPKLGNIITMLDMDVRRLGSFEAIKEESKARDSQDSRHRSTSMHSIGSDQLRINAAGPRLDRMGARCSNEGRLIERPTHERHRPQIRPRAASISNRT